jgi:hypothetical protein
MAADGGSSTIGGATTSPAGNSNGTDRRRKVAGRAEEVRDRALRRETQAREEKEATRRSNAAKSASLRALRLARAATAVASAGAAPSRHAKED